MLDVRARCAGVAARREMIECALCSGGAQRVLVITDTQRIQTPSR
jgi:hypothetical protein